MSCSSRRRSMLLGIFVTVMLAVVPAAASADFPQFRISNFGTDADLTQQASLPMAAYNTQTNQFFVVYEAGPEADDNHWTVYGQFLDADGTRLGDPKQISLPTADDLCLYDPPNVAYSEKLNEFLVTWNQGKAGNCDDNVRVQRVGADGTLLGDPSKQISASGFNDIETTNPVYNPFSNEWLVVWKSDVPTTSNQELFAQRLAADGSETGTDDQRLTDFTTGGGNVDDATAVAVNPTDGRYLAVVHGVDPTVVASRTEAWGHLMDATGAVVGPDHFRISHMADTNAASGDAQPPTVAYNPAANNFLVAWSGDPMIGSMVNNEQDIFGRFVSKDGDVLGTADARYSDLGPDGNTSFRPNRPDIRFNPNAGEFFFAFAGDDDTPPLVDNESEAFGQRVDANGNEVGDNDFRISHDGPDGDMNFAANRPALAYNSSICRYLVAWASGRVGSLGNASEEWDIYGNLVDSPCPPVNGAVPQITGTAQEGQTLTTSNGTWSGRGIAFGYQWLRDGQPIGGATQSTYVPAAADVNHKISSRVTATDPDGTASADSAAVSPTAKPVVVTPPPKDTTAPVCTASVARQKLGKVLKKGLKVTMNCNEAAKVSALLVIPAKVVKTLTAARALTAGKATKSTTKPGKFTITIKLGKKAKKLLKKARSVKMTLSTTATDTAGNRAKKRSKSLKLKR